MREQSTSWFQTRANGRTLESDSIRGAGVSVALNVKQPSRSVR